MEPAVPADRLLGFADTLEVTATAAPVAGPELHLVTFALDREEFGVPVGRVREVIRVSEIASSPRSGSVENPGARMAMTCGMKSHATTSSTT